MFDNSADRQANAASKRQVTPEKPEQRAERRWFEDALEDDEVAEALKSLRAKDQPKSNAAEAKRV